MMLVDAKQRWQEMLVIFGKDTADFEICRTQLPSNSQIWVSHQRRNFKSGPFPSQSSNRGLEKKSKWKKVLRTIQNTSQISPDFSGPFPGQHMISFQNVTNFDGSGTYSAYLTLTASLRYFG
jgi:hypothetical protein